MLDRHECELISAGLDGELAPGEQREHDELLASSAEARALRAELRGVGAALESLPEQAPPADLAERVLARAAPRDAKVTPLRPRWRRAHVPLAFAAGLLVAVAVSRLLPVGGSPLEQQPRTISTFRSIRENQVPTAIAPKKAPLPHTA